MRLFVQAVILGRPDRRRLRLDGERLDARVRDHAGDQRGSGRDDHPRRLPQLHAVHHFSIDPFLSVLIVVPIVFLLGVVIELAFIRPLRTQRPRVAVPARDLGGRARDRRRAGTRVLHDLSLDDPSYANDVVDDRRLRVLQVQVYAFARLAGDPRRCCGLLLAKTRFGRASGPPCRTPRRLRLLGVDAERVAAIGFGLSVATAAAAGAVYGVVDAVQPRQPLRPDLALLSIIVLGGMGSLLGTVVAAMLMGVSQALLATYISPTSAKLTFFILLIAIWSCGPKACSAPSSGASCENDRSFRCRGELRDRGRLVTFPFVFQANWVVNIAVFTMMYASLATAWNLLGGYSGYISLGNAAFFGVGAYAIANLFPTSGGPPGYAPFLIVPLVGVAVAVLSLPIGWIAFRTRGVTFAIVTDLAPVRRTDPRVTSCGRSRGIARAGRRRPTVPGGDLRATLLPGHAGDLPVRGLRLLVRPAGEARPRVVRGPRRRGSRARLGGRHRGREARHLRDEHGDHRDDRRDLGLLHDLHLSAVRGRPAGHDRHGADGVPRREGDALGPVAGRAPARACATVARAKRNDGSLVPDPVLGRVPGGDPAPASRDHPVGSGSHREAPVEGTSGAIATDGDGPAGPDGGHAVSAQTLLEVDGLSKRFGGVTAVSGTTFSVGSGTITGLIGPTGRGRPPCST